METLHILRELIIPYILLTVPRNSEISDLEMATRRDNRFLQWKWYNFDANFMKPLLAHSTPLSERTLPPLCLAFARICTSTRQSTVVDKAPDDSPCNSLNLEDG
ncbi:hypothetical protein KIN20_010142 [Parelaphostrongylus tenuis]|uniref:Uncharacterized protein n=1 Tax=Parelaphostrongylus tenuis TaxID=148309 RepID=A0AAD5QNW3_PARTN|nr:hypothetical protein KIN20_010142 [Parelaphostrongylus tenuis]